MLTLLGGILFAMCVLRGGNFYKTHVARRHSTNQTKSAGMRLLRIRARAVTMSSLKQCPAVPRERARAIRCRTCRPHCRRSSQRMQNMSPKCHSAGYVIGASSEHYHTRLLVGRLKTLGNGPAVAPLSEYSRGQRRTPLGKKKLWSHCGLPCSASTTAPHSDLRSHFIQSVRYIS